MKPFFQPTSIAVIGASTDKTKIGHVLVQNIKTLGFRGKVYPVNPKGGTLLNLPIYKSLAEIPGRIDWAVIAIPAAAVPAALQACAKKHIKTVIVISAGFSEIGESGKKLQASCESIVKKSGMRMLGPNCLGLILPHSKLNASFSKGMPKPGSVGVVSQSGAMAVAIADWAEQAGIGFSALISLGNKADINEQDALRFLSDDKKTKSIVMYLESLVTGRTFLNDISRISKTKPVVVLYPGVSTKAREAVQSHTGAIAGSHTIELQALHDAGAIVVPTMEDLFMLGALFERYRTLRATGQLAIVTNAGGPGIAATDAAEREHVGLASFSQATILQLKKKLPQAAAMHNPVDLVGDAPAKRYTDALRILSRDRKVSAIIVLLTHQYVTEIEKTVKVLLAFAKQNPRIPLFVSFIGGKGVSSGMRALQSKGVLCYPYPELAIRAYASLHAYTHTERQNFRLIPQKFAAKKQHVLLGKKAETFLKKFVKDVAPSSFVKTPDQAASVAARFGFPVVVKCIHQQFIHKTEHHMVLVNAQNKEAVRAFCTQLMKREKLRMGHDDGFLVQPYVRNDLEIFVGARRDPSFGPYVIVGIGGIFVESLPDHRIALAPLQLHNLKHLIDGGVLGAIKKSARGSGLAWNILQRIVLGISRMMIERPQVTECDCNPVLMAGKTAFVADVRIITKSS